MMRIFRNIGYSVCVIAIMVLVGSCSEPVGGMGKSPVFLTIEPQDTWTSHIDVYDSSLPGGVGPDTFWLTIKSNYKSQNTDLVTPYADVILQEYRVSYYRPDGKTSVPAPFMVQFQGTVPAGGSYAFEALVMRSDAKLRSPLKELVFGSGEGYILFNAVMDFYGEDLMGNKVEARYVLSMRAADL